MSERFSEVSYEGFRSVVDRLVYRDIDDVCTHAGGYYEASASLLLEYLADVFGAVYNTVH